MALQFWKPGTQGPGSSLDRASEAEGHVIPSLSSGGQQYGIQDQRERLPIFKHSAAFVLSTGAFATCLTEGTGYTLVQERNCYIVSRSTA